VVASDLALFLSFLFLFWMCPSRILVVTKYNSCKGQSSSPLPLLFFVFASFSIDLDYHWNIISLM
jgi:hypothetical protein